MASSTNQNPYLLLPEGPELRDEVDEGEGHREGAEEDVGDGQVGDEDVPRRQHHLQQTD